MSWIHCLVVISTVTSQLVPIEQEEGQDPIKCPLGCTCTSGIYEPVEVLCDRLGIREIPKNLPLDSVEIDLSYNLITSVRRTAFRGMKQLRTLILNSNQIDFIENGSFDDLGSLMDLTLSRNRLSSLHKQLFKQSTRLGFLDISFNRFTSIPEFDPMPTLNKLVISNNLLTNVSFPLRYNSLFLKVEMGNNKEIKEIHETDFNNVKGNLLQLNLENCGLQNIESGAFSGQGMLNTLSLSNNPGIAKVLPNIWPDFKDGSLSLLNLDGVFRNRDLLPSTFSSFNWTHSGELSLMNNIVGVLRSGTFQTMPFLRKLYLHNSSITAIENNAFSGLDNLRHLDLSLNFLFDIPAHLPSSIAILDLSENKNITELKSNQFRNLRNINTLRLTSCSINRIHNDAFIGLDDMVMISLSHNNLTGNSLITSTFYQARSLETIMMTHNPIGSIPDSAKAFQDIPNLREVDFSESSIRSFPYNLFLNSSLNLNSLFLAGNELGPAIERDSEGRMFGRLNALTYLDLQENKISHIPSNLFQNLGSLQVLDLSQNFISSWELGLFTNTPLLSKMRMDLNNITSLSLGHLKEVGQLLLWNLSGNPFNCDCHLVSFRTWMTYTNVTLYGYQKYRCVAPKNLGGYKLLELNPRNMTCSKPSENVTNVTTIFIIITVVFVLIFLVGMCVLVVIKYRERYLVMNIEDSTNEELEHILDDSDHHQNTPRQAFSISRILANRNRRK